jgi:hypothetical protein
MRGSCCEKSMAAHCSPSSGRKQTTDHRTKFWVAGRDLLKVGVGHRDAARDCAAIVGANLIDMTVYSAVSVAVLHDGVDEGAGCLVQIPRLDDELREGMIVFLEEELSEARCAFFGLVDNGCRLYRTL